MLMCMKGHSGKCPCRVRSTVALLPLHCVRSPLALSQACKIIGIWWKNHYYFALRNPKYGAGEVAHNPTRPDYNPRALPLRDHDQFIADAIAVGNSANYADASRDVGINKVGVISQIPGTDMVRSFALELMHLLFENVMKVSLEGA